jgi:RNA polymerase sigma factor (sigma-70 family)
MIFFVTYLQVSTLIVKCISMDPEFLRRLETSKLDDAAIVKRVLSGEKELFEILLRRHNQKLFRVIRSYLREQVDVEDAMQDTYLKAFDRLQQFQGVSSFSTWLIRIGINEALLRVKKNKVRSFNHGMQDVMSNAIIQLPDPQMNPEKLAIGQETKKLIEHAIDQLPPKYRVIYVLKEVEGMDNSEIADNLGITRSNVKVRLHRAKNLMKDTLLHLSSDKDIFEFGAYRCDAMVDCVMKRI